MPPGYPGSTALCFGGYPSALSAWIAVIGSLAYGLWIEVALLAALWLWRRWALRVALLAIGTVAATALVATLADDLTARLNGAMCRYQMVQGNPHISTLPLTTIMRTLNTAFAQANILFLVTAVAFVIGTFATARLAVMACRRRAAG